MNKINKLESCGAVLVPINYLEFRIKFPNLDFNVNEKNLSTKFLTNVECNNIIVESGDVFKLDTGVSEIRYKVNSIAKTRDSNVIACSESVYNKATQFILPLVMKDIDTSSYLKFTNGRYKGFLVNTYMEFEGNEKSSKNSVYILMKFINNDTYVAMENRLVKQPNFVKAHDIHKNYVLYEFLIPEKFQNDACKIIDGMYSKVSRACKSKIINFFGAKTIEGGIVHRILDRAPEVIRQMEEDLDVCLDGFEICSKFNEEEILTKNML